MKSFMLPKILLFALFFVILVNPVYSISVSFQPDSTNGTDTFVSGGASSTNFGTAGYTTWGSTSGAVNYSRRALFNFNFTCDSIPPNHTIHNVNIEITPISVYQPTNATVYPMNQSWDESTLTWNNCGTGGCNGWYNDTWVIGRKNANLPTTKFNITLDSTWFEQECNKNIEDRFGFIILGIENVNADYHIVADSSDSTTPSKRPKLYINYTLPDITPPQITVLSPDTTYNETYNANIWINFTTDENANCSLNETAFIVFSDTGTDFRYNESTLDDGFYAVNISCEDSLSNEDSTIVYFTKDTASPVITSILPLEDNSSSFNNTGIINITFLLQDNIDLRVYNLTISELISGINRYNSSAVISGTSYLFSELIDVSDWNNTIYKQTVRTCDSHTKMLVKEAEEIVKEYDTLKFHFDDINIDIKSIGGNEISTETEKLSDRYTFKFNYDKVTSTKTYELTSSHKITYLPKSKFKGHFVLGNTLWIDFSNAGKVTVEKSGDNYLITVENSGQSIEFNSIGYLNCVEEHYQFELIEICENVTCITYDVCQPDVSGGLQDCIAVNETEECVYTGDYTEFQSSCDYCTPILDTNVFCAGWSGTCPTNYTEYCLDINNTCYDETGASSDIYGVVTRGCVGTYGSGEIVEVIMDNIIGIMIVIFSLISIIALALIFAWVVKKWKK